MGELKTRFMRGDRYGIRVVVWQVATLLHELHARTASFDSIRSEDLENKIWDDLVIERGSATTRWQVKRQTTPIAFDHIKEILVGAQKLLAGGQPGPSSRFHIAFR